MRLAALLFALFATIAGFFFGIPLAFVRGAYLFDAIPPYIVPILSVIGCLLVYFRPQAAAIFLILSALATAVWPFAIASHLGGSEQLSQDTIAFRTAMIAIPSVLATLAAILSWRSRKKS